MGFFTDTSVCIGCKACEVACKQWNDLPADGAEFPRAADTAQVDVADSVRKMGDWVFMSDVCKHCTNAGCLDACPTGALIRTEHETVVVQPDVCNGCGYCVPSCPFGVIDRDHIDG